MIYPWVFIQIISKSDESPSLKSWQPAGGKGDVMLLNLGVFGSFNSMMPKLTSLYCFIILITYMSSFLGSTISWFLKLSWLSSISCPSGSSSSCTKFSSTTSSSESLSYSFSAKFIWRKPNDCSLNWITKLLSDLEASRLLSFRIFCPYYYWFWEILETS